MEEIMTDPAAATTDLNIDFEDALEPLCPGHTR
jgi:hypothetical protein